MMQERRWRILGGDEEVDLSVKTSRGGGSRNVECCLMNVLDYFPGTYHKMSERASERHLHTATEFFEDFERFGIVFRAMVHTRLPK